MNIFITIGFVAGVALVIYGVQWLVSAGVSKVQDVGEGMLYRHQVNKEGGQQLTAEDMRKANRVVKAFEKGIISEDSFDREIERIEDESFARSAPFMTTCVNGHPCTQYVTACRICGVPVNQSPMRAGDARARLHNGSITPTAQPCRGSGPTGFCGSGITS